MKALFTNKKVIWLITVHNSFTRAMNQRFHKRLFHRILTTSALCLAAVGACPLCAAEPASPSLVGKVLVLKIKDAEKRYAFSDSHVVRKSSRFTPLTDGTERQIWQEIYYVYSPETAEFYEENRINSTSGKVRDGYGYSRWKLQFNTASSGTAMLITKHHFSLRRHKVGLSVPFRVEPLPPNTHLNQVQKKTF